MKKNLKVGDIIYSVYATYDVDGQPKHLIELETWVVSAIRNTKRYGIENKTIYLILDNKYTRDKQGSWAKNIPSYWKKKFYHCDTWPVYTTKRQAFIQAVKELKNKIIRYENTVARSEDILANEEELLEWKAEISGNEKVLSMLKGRLTKLKNKNPQ